VAPIHDDFETDHQPGKRVAAEGANRLRACSLP
jgi:hypothetical protein